MSNRTLPTAICLVCVAGCLGERLAEAQSPLQSQSMDWIAQPWSGSDAPFLQARAQIDSELRQGARADDLLQQARAQSLQNPFDAVSTYRWGYLATIVAAAARAPSDQHRAIDGLAAAMGVPGYVGSREFARVRFLVNGISAPLWPLGERLVKAYPHDRLVEENQTYIAISCLPDSRGDQRYKAEALRLIGALKKQYPGQCKYTQYAAIVYFTEWQVYSRVEDAETAIRYFDQFAAEDRGRDPDRLAVCQGLEAQVQSWLLQHT